MREKLTDLDEPSRYELRRYVDFLVRMFRATGSLRHLTIEEKLGPERSIIERSPQWISGNNTART
jgi:hypothetical protein